jgi:2-phosphoglycerate kinase
LAKIKKRSGAMQDFDRAKLKRSLKKAGAKDEHATKVAETVGGRVREGMTTADIKRHATTELRRMDQKTATAYETFRKPKI